MSLLARVGCRRVTTLCTGKSLFLLSCTKQDRSHTLAGRMAPPTLVQQASFATRPPASDETAANKNKSDLVSSMISGRIWGHLEAVEKKYSKLKEDMQSGISQSLTITLYH